MKVLLFLLTCVVANAFSTQKKFCRRQLAVKSSHSDGEQYSRRSTLNGITAALLLGLTPMSANASVRTREELIKVGTQAPARDGDRNFVELPNGVKIKDYRIGTGDETVKDDSQVMIQATGRLLKFNGFVFYSTKNNNPDGFGALPLTINLGKGEALPGLEAGIVGMRKGGIRRILIPSHLAYNNFHDLEPRTMSANDQRALDSVVQNPNMDATVLFDVSLERFK